jgi:periplasmic protein TonB
VYTTKANRGARTSAAAVVIAGHAAVIYALAVTMGVVEAPPIVEPIKAVFIDSPPVEPEPYVPPETPPVAQQPVVDVPLPDIPPIPTPVETITVPPVTEVPPSTEPSTPAVIDAKSLSVTRRVEPIYPPASRRLDEHGAVRLKVLVDETGRPREVQVAKSSGFDRLDQAAVAAVRRWQFSPAMQESRAVTAWTQVNVVFQLNR